jgi:hypothetical protein
VAPEIFEEQREKAARQLSEAIQDIQYGLRVGLCKLVESLRDDLAPGPNGGRKRLYESAVTKLTEFLAHFDVRNVTDDRELKQVIDQLRGLPPGKHGGTSHHRYRAAANPAIPLRYGWPLGSDGAGRADSRHTLCRLAK